VTAWHRVNHAALQQIIRGPNGAVAKDMLKRLVRVESAAKKNLDRPPRRINTGHLRASLTRELTLGPHGWIGRVGTNVSYARWVHDGTGIYGPHHALIVPRTAKALRWRGGGGVGKLKGDYVYARWSRGMPPNPFLKDAVPAAKIT
jgi:hypothetical protein